MTVVVRAAEKTVLLLLRHIFPDPVMNNSYGVISLVMLSSSFCIVDNLLIPTHVDGHSQ